MVYLPSTKKMIAILIWIVNLTSGNCPDDLLQEVFSCLHNLTEGMDSGMLIASADVDLMKFQCEAGGFHNSVMCLEKIYDKCTSPKDMERLRKYASPVAWRSGFRRFCSNIDEYTSRRSCVAEQNKAVDNCVNKNLASLTSRDPEAVREEQKGYSIEEREDENIRQVCTLFYWTNHCFNTVPSKCGEAISAILSDFAGGLTPPVCRGFRLTNASSKSYQNQLTSYLLSCLLISYLYNKFFVSI